MTNLKQGKDLSDHLKQQKEKEDGDKRSKACEEEIVASLKKHNCLLDAVMMVGRNGNAPQITILAKKPEEVIKK